jgi:hypothetical protein
MTRKDASGDYVKTGWVDPLWKYVRNKKSPALNLVDMIRTRRNFNGKKIDSAADVGAEAAQFALYMFLNDAAEASMDQWQTTNPAASIAEGTAVGALSWLGGSVNTYEDGNWIKLKRLRREAAESTYGKELDDLSYRQFKSLVTSRDPVQRDLVDRIAADHSDDPEEVLTIDRGEDIEAGQEILNALPDAQANFITSLRGQGGGVSLDTRRVLDITMPGNRKEKWRMNDARFKQYKGIVARVLTSRIASMMANPVSPLGMLPADQQREKLAKAIEDAKKVAGDAIKNQQ